MEFKGTKGEWEVLGHSVYAKDRNNIVAFLDASLSNMNLSKLKANAQIIASAPELLEALKDLVMYCDQWEVGADLQLAEKAINKALGNESK